MREKSYNKEESRTNRRSWRYPLLLVILLTGFSLRGLYLLEIKDNPDFAYPAIDGSYHDYWARGLITGNWAVPPGREDPQIYRYPFYRPPGYAYFLALIYRVSGFSYFWPRVAQMLIGIGSALLAFFLGRRWFGRAVGLIFSLLMSTYWIFIYFEGELIGVALAVFLGLLLLSVLGRFTGIGYRSLENLVVAPKAFGAHRETHPTPVPVGLPFGGVPTGKGCGYKLRYKGIWGNGLISGLLLGLYALFRPNVLLFLPVAAGWIIWVARRRKARWGWTLACLVLGTGVALAPVTIRNYAVGGEFVPIATNLGVSSRVANNELTDATTHVIPGLGDIGTPYDWPRIVRHLERRLGRKLSHSGASSYLTGEALRFMRERPGKFFRLLGRKALLFWGPSEIRNIKEIHFARLHSPVLRNIPANFPFVVSLSVIGVFLLFLDIRAGSGSGEFINRGRFEVAVLLALFIGTYFFSMLPFAAAARYRVPIIPFLLLFGAYGLKRMGEFGVRREWLRMAFCLGVGAVFYILVSKNYAGHHPSPEKWHYDLALAYTDQEDWYHAVREYEEAVELKPDFVRAYNNLGNIYTLLGDYEKAVGYYNRVIQLRPDLAQGYSNLGNALYRQGMLDKAISYLKKALMIRPDLVEAHNNLGVVLLRRGRTEEAIGHYREALVYKPADVTARVNLSNALIRQGKVAEARKLLETALRIQPDCEAARRALEKIQSGKR